MEEPISHSIPAATDGGPRPRRRAERGPPAAAGAAIEPLRIVTDQRSADLLTDPRTLRQLAPFLGRELSIARAAAETGEKPNTVLARARRLQELGLLVVTRELPRAGRPIKLYRAAADCFFIPFDTTSAESLEALLAERDAYWEKLLRESVVRARREQVGSWGTRIYRDPRGRLQVQAAVTPDANYTTLEPGGPPVLAAWRDTVYLDYEDAKALQREMFELLKRYQQKEGAQRFLVRLGMAPLQES